MNARRRDGRLLLAWSALGIVTASVVLAQVAVRRTPGPLADTDADGMALSVLASDDPQVQGGLHPLPAPPGGHLFAAAGHPVPPLRVAARVRVTGHTARTVLEQVFPPPPDPNRPCIFHTTIPPGTRLRLLSADSPLEVEPLLEDTAELEFGGEDLGEPRTASLAVEPRQPGIPLRVVMVFETRLGSDGGVLTWLPPGPAGETRLTVDLDSSLADVVVRAGGETLEGQPQDGRGRFVGQWGGRSPGPVELRRLGLLAAEFD